MSLLIDAALKGSLLIIAAAVAAYLLRGRSAAARHAAWTAAVIGHLALPALALFLPQWNLGLLPEPSWIRSSVVTVPASQVKEESAPVAMVNESEPASEPASANPTAPASANTTVPAPQVRPSLLERVRSTNVDPVTLVWLVGLAVVLLRLAVGTWKVGRLAKDGDRVDDGEWLSLTQRLANRLDITRPLTLLRGDRLGVPVTWGVVYPAVLLPPDSIQWPEERRRFVLVHEMAHVKRFDALTQLVAQLAIAVFWFDPLVWLAAHRMRVEREHACDDYVLRDGTKPSLYAGELLEMVQQIGAPSRESAAPAFAALAMARRSEFEGRMLAILDNRQDRHTLGRRRALLTTAVLALLVLPLAAMRPFGARTLTPAAITSANISNKAEKPAASSRISANACDSVMDVPNHTQWNHVNVENGDGGETKIVEYLGSSENRCAQGIILGESQFSNDRLISLGSGSYVTITEVTSSSNRTVHITPRDNGTLEFTARSNGALVPFDDTMRAWLARLLPEILTETAVDVPQRVARDMARGGVSAVLNRIATIRSTNSRRAHYEALLDGRPLTQAEYDRVARHASRYLSGSASDLRAVLDRIAAGPAKGTKSLGQAVATLGRAQDALANALDAALNASRTASDTAQALTQYGITDDPDMLLMALQGAADMSSDTDRRVLLQTLAAGSLRRSNPALRKAFFDAAGAMTSDTDLRVVLQTALPYGHSDPLVTKNVLRLVGDIMTSDSDKRVVLTTATAQKLIKTAELRADFMKAARTMTSDSDLSIVMQSLLIK